MSALSLPGWTVWGLVASITVFFWWSSWCFSHMNELSVLNSDMHQINCVLSLKVNSSNRFFKDKKDCLWTGPLLCTNTYSVIYGSTSNNKQWVQMRTILNLLCAYDFTCVHFFLPKTLFIHLCVKDYLVIHFAGISLLMLYCYHWKLWKFGRYQFSEDHWSKIIRMKPSVYELTFLRT